MHISVKFKREYSNYEAIMSTYVLPLAFRRIPLGSRYWMRGDFNYLQVWCVVFSKISCRRTDRKMERIAKIIVPMSFKRKEQLMGVKDVYFVYFKVKGIYFLWEKYITSSACGKKYIMCPLIQTQVCSFTGNFGFL